MSIALIGIGVAGIFMVMPSLIHSSLLADQTIVATNLASETMEDIIAQKDCNETGCGYASTLSAISTGFYDANPVNGFAGYAISTSQLEVDPDNDDAVDDFLDASPGSGYARITVTISWNSGASSISLATLLADY